MGLFCQVYTKCSQVLVKDRNLAYLSFSLIRENYKYLVHLNTCVFVICVYFYNFRRSALRFEADKPCRDQDYSQTCILGQEHRVINHKLPASVQSTVSPQDSHCFQHWLSLLPAAQLIWFSFPHFSRKPSNVTTINVISVSISLVIIYRVFSTVDALCNCSR